MCVCGLGICFPMSPVCVRAVIIILGRCGGAHAKYSSGVVIKSPYFVYGSIMPSKWRG